MIGWNYYAVASMCRQKGLPNLEAVEKLLNWSRWYKPKPDGSFDMELFRAVAPCVLKRLAKFGSCKGIAELVSLEEEVGW